MSSAKFEKCAEEVLDGSLSLLDTCGTARDIICLVKESVQDFESSIRRNKIGVSGLAHDLDDFGISRKKINKVVTKSIKNLKKLEKNRSSAPLNEVEDCDHLSHHKVATRDRDNYFHDLEIRVTICIMHKRKLKPGRVVIGFLQVFATKTCP